MNLNDYIPLIKAAERYAELITFMNSRPERNIEWDLVTIESVLRDFHFIATPGTVAGLFQYAQQLEQDLSRALASVALAQQEIARFNDVKAVSACGDVIQLPQPATLFNQEGEAISGFLYQTVVDCLSRQGFEVREVAQ